VPKATYLADAVLGLLFRSAPFTKPGTLYIALHTADPTATGNVGELAIGVGGYARAPVTVGDASFSAPASAGAERFVANTGVLTFGTATAALGTVTHYSIKDAATAGNTLYYGALSAARTIANGDPIQVPAGGITIREG
jgi:hypothetical protein